MKKFIVFLFIVLLGFGGWLAWQHWHQAQTEPASEEALAFDVSEIPEWTGDPSIEINEDQPDFAEEDLKPEFFESFSELDRKGRCGQVVACVDREHMPEGERGSIGMVRPSGWQISKYDFIDNGGYLFNRCHLIGWQLTGENAEERNLITGTRYMNVEGMLPYEDKVAAYVRDTGNHVLYRVTPVFVGKELVARGVQLEAESVEDSGQGVEFNVYCYNVQPGVEIDYLTGDNRLAESSRGQEMEETQKETAMDDPSGTDPSREETSNEKASQGDAPANATKENDPGKEKVKMDYVLNTNTRRFHYPDCSSVRDMSEKNKKTFHGTRKKLIRKGYLPCGVCKP